MTIGLPQNLSFQNSNVTCDLPSLEELLVACTAPVFQEGLLVCSGSWIWEYQGVDFTPKIWKLEDEEAGVYQLDEILLKDCELVKVTGKSGTGVTFHQKPKSPEEYSCYDYDMDYNSWSCRYVAVDSSTECNWLTKVWPGHNKQYTIVWSSSSNQYEWVLRDVRTSAQCGTSYFPLVFSGTYDSSKDIKAKVIEWGGIGMSRSSAIVIKSMVERGSEFYLRTHLDLPLEYHTWTTGTEYQYSYGSVQNPEDIDGFIQKQLHPAHAPFDGKNYTKTVYATDPNAGFARWDVIATEDIDSIAFGGIICDVIDFRISDQEGNTLFELNNFPVDNSVAPNRPEVWPATVVLYADKTYPAGSVITIFLKATLVTVGEIIGASKLDAGFTKVVFKNSFKDFSPKEQDQWGNWTYIDGVRVKTHTGTVEYRIASYDQLNRLMLMIGGQKVVINSSDSTENQVPDGRKVFEATQMIGRFIKLDLASTEQKKRIGEIATYSFQVEELV